MTEIIWTPERVSAFWDEHTRHPENHFTNHSGAQIARNIRPYLRSRDRVLDYGCGMGHFVPHLARLGLRVTATDVSPKSIACANDMNVDVPYFLGAHHVDDLIARELKFDAAVSIEVVEHLTNAALDHYLTNLTRLLAPGAVVVFTTPNAENLGSQTVFCPNCRHSFHRWQHVRSWTAETLFDMIERHGLRRRHSFATNLALTAKGKLILKLIGRFDTPHLVCVADHD